MIAEDESGREDIQIRCMLSQALHAIGPVLAAVHQDFDGVPDFGNRGASGGLAGQHFQDGQLEGHFHVSGLALEVSARSVNRPSKFRHYRSTIDAMDQALRPGSITQRS
ncbi:hypothetical protein AC628_32190 [Bradyrhizobium sp. NAS96.2]|nr:hypothetical protein AC628_32190 [Bradyrhizobium sp. NAS96.2]